MSIRIGVGFQSQIFKDNTPLILGGLEIPFKSGLNRDVLISAICDAMFGALATGSVNEQFSDQNEIHKNTHSHQLLIKSYDLIRQEGYELNNMDGLIFSKGPIITDWITEIRENLVEILWCQKNHVSIKEATSKDIIFTPNEDGIAALITITLKPRKGR